MANHYPSLNAKKALIWRIVHCDNLLWILDNGLHCGNSGVQAPGWVGIGNPELIDKRANHSVPLLPGGFLNDYVPFYFTPFSPMLWNIHTGWGGIQRRPNGNRHPRFQPASRCRARSALPVHRQPCLLSVGELLFRFGRSRQDRLAAASGARFPA